MVKKVYKNNKLGSGSQGHSKTRIGPESGPGALIGASEGSHIPSLLDPQVGERIDGSTYGDLLAQPDLFRNESPAIYVHLPFCPARCLSCDHITSITHDSSEIDRYLDDLERELDMVAEQISSTLSPVQLYIGGGTPNYLSDPQLLRLADMLEQHFDLDKIADSTIEISPRRSSASQLQMLRGLGFRALKLEVRDLDPEVQKALAKTNSMAVLEDVFHNAREAGFETIGMDLLYGLPTQTLSSVRETVAGIIQLEPDRLNCYAYARQPEMFRHQRAIQSPSLPSLADRLIMFNGIVDGMEGAGYTWVGLDSFARLDDDLVEAQEQRRLGHNWMGYNTHGSQTVLGFGASAISEVGGACVQNFHDIAPWSDAIQHDSFALRAGVQLSERGMQHRRAVNGLLSNMQLDGWFQPGEGSESVRALETLQEQGYLQLEADRVSVTPEGRYLLHHVAGNSALDIKWSNDW